VDPNIYEYQLSAVRLRIKWPSIFRQEDDGDLVGYTINYAIDLQTNGGAFQTVINTSVTGKRPAVTSAATASICQPVPQRGRFDCAKLRQMQTAQKSATR
jgi:predicted phage tail protein